MKRSIPIKVEHGYLLFKLGTVLEEHHTSLNQLMKDTGTDYKVIKRYQNGTIARIDIDVLTRFCHYFHCTIHDIIEYCDQPEDKKI